MYKPFKTLFFILAAAGCTHPSELPPTPAKPLQPAETAAEAAQSEETAEKTDAVPAKPQKSPALTAAETAPIAARGAANTIAVQKIVREPDAAHVLYLMRAARYREAAHYAPLAPQTESMKFIAQKARIKAGLCTADDPCSKRLEALTVPDNCLEETFDYWRAAAYTADLDFKGALRAAAAYHDKYKQTDRTQELVLELAKTAVRHGILCGGGSAQKAEDAGFDFDRMKSLIAKASPKMNAFESASMAHVKMCIAEAEGDASKAAAERRTLILRYPATQMSLWPELAPSPEDVARNYSGEEHFGRIRRLIAHFDYDNARRELKYIVDSPKTSRGLREKAEWELARVSMTNSEEPKLSENIYRKFAAKSGPHREDAVFGIARALSRQLKYPEAIQALENYDRKYPRGKYKKRSLYLRGWYEFDLRNDERARPLLLKYAEMTNDTSVWGFYAQSFLRGGLWRESIDAFDKLMRAGNPIVRGKALYWQAYAYRQLGDDKEARAHFDDLHRQYPLTWYDFLAYARESEWYGTDLEQAYIAAFRQKSDRQPELVFHAFGLSPKAPEMPKSGILADILTLAEFDDVEKARSLYNKNEKAILSRFPAKERQAARVYLTHLVESYNRAWEDAAGSIRAYSDIWPERGTPKHHLAYPQPFAPLIESLAGEYGIPRFFMYGIMLQESRFRPWQVSSADAIGALQMIPRTARPIARALGLEYHPDTFFDPKVGFVYSAYYMKSHFDRWGGNLTFTAGSYNGGPHRIGPWALRDKGRTIDIIVDEFSFDESRHYARKVAEHTLRFAYLYARNEREWLDTVHALFPVVVPDITPTDDWGL